MLLIAQSLCFIPVKYVYHYVLHYLKFNKKKTKLNFIMFSIELTHLLRSMLRLKISYFITHPIHENCIFQTSKACLIIHFTSVEHHFVRLHHAIRSRRVFFYPLLTFHSLFTVLYDYVELARTKEKDSNWEFDLYCFILSFLDGSNMDETVCDVSFE